MSSGGSRAPMPYMPTGQGQADQSLQGVWANSMPYATSLPGQVIPGAQDVVNNVRNNPYYPGAQQGANDVAGMAGQVAQGMFGAAGQLNANAGSLGGTVGQLNANAGWMNSRGNELMGSGALYTDPVYAGANAAYNRGAVLSDRAADLINPASLASFSLAPGILKSGMDKANTAWNQSQAAIPALTGGLDRASQMLNTGFDPQGDLYNREFSKQQDQQNAINAMYGVASSPYGAGVAGDASRNFNMDWQNNQLSRQLAALQGYGNFTGQVTSNLTGLMNTGGNQYNALSTGAVGNYNNILDSATNRANTLMQTSSQAMNQGVDNQRQGYATGANILDSLNRGATNMYAGANSAYNTVANMYDTQANQYGAASAHATDGLNTMFTSSQLPSSVYMGQQNAQLQALQGLAGVGNQALNPSFQMMQALEDYLRTGQSATQVGQQGTQINNQRAAQSGAGLMSALGTLGGLALAGGTGGLSLFGSLAGGAGALGRANAAAFATLGGNGS